MAPRGLSAGFRAQSFQVLARLRPGCRHSEGPETWRIANNLRLTGNFANPFLTLDTGPSAHLAPLFPGFLALLTKLFGIHGGGVFAYKFTVVLAVSLLLGLFPLVSRLLGMGR